MEMIMQTPSFNTECYKLPPPASWKQQVLQGLEGFAASRKLQEPMQQQQRRDIEIPLGSPNCCVGKKNTFLQDHNKLWPPATSLDIHGYPISIQVTHAAPNNSSASRCAAAASTSSNRCSRTRTAAEFPSSRTAGARSSARHWSHCRASRPGCTQTTVALLNACNYL